MSEQPLCLRCHVIPVLAPKMICYGCMAEHLENQQREVRESQKHWASNDVGIPIPFLSPLMKREIDKIVEKLKEDEHG